MYTNKQLLKLILPLLVEQTLSIFVGMADTVMVSALGDAAISGVSLVDMICNVLITLFAALATGGAVVSVVHDLSLARAYGTHAILMRKGKIISAGEIREVMTPDHLNEVYSMDVYEWMRGLYGQWTDDVSQHG